MRLHDSALVPTPTDIANHLACRHLTQLDRARLAGERIELRQDPRIDALRHRGETHEKGFVDSLAAEGLSVTDLRHHDDPATTLDAMTAGADVIVQAPLQGDGLSGRADVLLRIAVPSRLGAYSSRRHEARARHPRRHDPPALRLRRPPRPDAGPPARAHPRRDAARTRTVPHGAFRRVLPLRPSSARGRSRGRPAAGDLPRARSPLRRVPVLAPL